MGSWWCGSGVRLPDEYLEFLAGRCRPNTVAAVAYDLKVFFTVVGKPPRRVRLVDVLTFMTAQRTGGEGRSMCQPCLNRDEGLCAEIGADLRGLGEGHSGRTAVLGGLGDGWRFACGESPGRVRLVTWWTSRHGTPSAAWWTRMARSSGPSSWQ
jgi:hypothetical protein